MLNDKSDFVLVDRVPRTTKDGHCSRPGEPDY